MLTNDKNAQVLINEILANKYELNLIQITITQREEKLIGKGIIHQNEEGQLLLRFFSDKDYSESERLIMFVENHNRSNSEGNIISEYDKMEGRDENGRKYFCDHVLNNGSKDNVMVFKLLGALGSDEDKEFNTRAIFAGKYSTPDTTNAYFETNVDQIYRFTDYKHVWRIDVNEEFKILATNYDHYLDVLILEEKDIEFRNIDEIIDSLNFVLGVELEPVFINVTNLGHKILNRRNFLKSKSLFSAPLTSNHNYGNEFTTNHNKLFCLYYNFIRQDSKKKLPTIQKRTVSGSRNYVYPSALVLSVQIETICKEYFSSYYNSDVDFIHAVEDGINIISKSNITRKSEVVGLLKNAISKKPERNISTTNILKNVAEQRIIDKSLLKNWKNLRNITAHGNSYEGEDEYHPLLSDMFLCTNLYYQLIFALIGYEGKYSWKEYKKNRIETYPLVEQN